MLGLLSICLVSSLPTRENRRHYLSSLRIKRQSLPSRQSRTSLIHQSRRSIIPNQQSAPSSSQKSKRPTNPARQSRISLVQQTRRAASPSQQSKKTSSRRGKRPNNPTQQSRVYATRQSTLPKQESSRKNSASTRPSRSSTISLPRNKAPVWVTNRGRGFSDFVSIVNRNLGRDIIHGIGDEIAKNFDGRFGSNYEGSFGRNFDGDPSSFTVVTYDRDFDGIPDPISVEDLDEHLPTDTKFALNDGVVVEIDVETPDSTEDSTESREVLVLNNDNEEMSFTSNDYTDDNVVMPLIPVNNGNHRFVLPLENSAHNFIIPNEDIALFDISSEESVVVPEEPKDQPAFIPLDSVEDITVEDNTNENISDQRDSDEKVAVVLTENLTKTMPKENGKIEQNNQKATSMDTVNDNKALMAFDVNDSIEDLSLMDSKESKEVFINPSGELPEISFNSDDSIEEAFFRSNRFRQIRPDENGEWNNPFFSSDTRDSLLTPSHKGIRHSVATFGAEHHSGTHVSDIRPAIYSTRYNPSSHTVSASSPLLGSSLLRGTALPQRVHGYTNIKVPVHVVKTVKQKYYKTVQVPLRANDDYW